MMRSIYKLLVSPLFRLWGAFVWPPLVGLCGGLLIEIVTASRDPKPVFAVPFLHRLLRHAALVAAVFGTLELVLFLPPFISWQKLPPLPWGWFIWFRWDMLLYRDLPIAAYWCLWLFLRSRHRDIEFASPFKEEVIYAISWYFRDRPSDYSAHAAANRQYLIENEDNIRNWALSLRHPFATADGRRRLASFAVQRWRQDFDVDSSVQLRTGQLMEILKTFHGREIEYLRCLNRDTHAAGSHDELDASGIAAFRTLVRRVHTADKLLDEKQRLLRSYGDQLRAMGLGDSETAQRLQQRDRQYQRIIDELRREVNLD